MFLKVDGTFVAQLINFAIFFAILNVVFIRPVSVAIVKRREYINSVTNDYDRYQAQANDLRAHAEAVRATARREAEASLAKARGEATNQSAAIATEYQQKVEQIVSQAHRTVEEELQAARASQPQQVNELAALMVQRTLTEQAG